jgi:hypothetical protein
MINNIGSGYSFPNPFVPPSQKDYKYILAYGQALYSKYRGLDTNIGACNTDQYQINREYVLGLQDVLQYKDKVDIVDSKTEDSYHNIDWGQLPVLHKPFNIFKGMMGDMSTAITTVDMSPLSINAKKEKEKTDSFNFLFKEELTVINEALGNPQPNLSRYKSLEDVEMYYRNDYKTNEEILAAKAWNIIADNNDFDSEINQQLAGDLFVAGVCATRDYVDSNGLIKIRRINPDNLIVDASDRLDFKDCQHFGEIMYLTIAQLREMAAASSQLIPESEWEKLGQTSRNVGSLSVFGDRQRDGYGYYYDSARIPVLDFEFESINRYEYEKYQDDEGNEQFVEVDKNFGTEKEEAVYDKKRTSKDIRVLYTGKWIIGTDYIFDAGLVQNIKRTKGLGGVISNFHVYAPSKIGMRVKSLAEMSIPYINNIHVAWYKFQAAVTSASPKGLAIDMAAITGIMKGQGQTWKALDIIELRKATGNQLYRSRDDNNNVIGGGRLPIEEIENGMAADTFRFLDIIQRNQQSINELIGFNDISAGSNPNPEVGKAQSQMAAQATNNALKPLITAYTSVFLRTAKSCIDRLQATSKHGVKGYISSIGESGMAVLGSHPDMSMCDMAITVKSIPQTEELAILNQFIQRELSVKSEGLGGGLDTSDALAIFDLMKTNLKEASLLLDKRKADNARAFQAQQQASSEANAQAQAQASMQAQQQSIEVTMMLEKQKMEMKSAFESQMAQFIEQSKTERQAMMDEAAKERELIKAEKDIIVAEIKADSDMESKAVDTFNLLEDHEHEREMSKKIE